MVWYSARVRWTGHLQLANDRPAGLTLATLQGYYAPPVECRWAWGAWLTGRLRVGAASPLADREYLVVHGPYALGRLEVLGAAE